MKKPRQQILLGEYREIPRKCLVFGRRSVSESLRSNSSQVEKVILSPTAKFEGDFCELIKQSQICGVKLEFVEQAIISALAKGINHQGIAAILKPLAKSTEEAIIQKGLSEKGIIVVLDQVEDPQNLGSILRAAECCGVSAVLATRDHSADLTPAARRVSCGASELIDFAQVVNLSRALENLRQKGYFIVGAALGKGSKSLYEADVSFPLAVVLGSEGKGLRKLTKENCDVLLHIPMKGRIGSLNVAQAAAVFLSEFARRRIEE